MTNNPVNNPLKLLETFGQSIWLDYIRRELMTCGGLRQMIKDDGLRGLSSNPEIFEKAIVESQDYTKDILSLSLAGKSAKEIYEALSQSDVQSAADEFLPMYDKTDGHDGYVSLEVNPHLAHDTSGTILEAGRLWGVLNRPNVFIKVPATVKGLPAIQQLTSQGININATLLFGLPRYRQVAEAYMTGIEMRIAQGESVEHVASVASFFLSRIDALVDPLLEKQLMLEGIRTGMERHMLGQIAVASARLAYQDYKEIFASDRFKKLADQGARPQRLLWASTGIQNPEDYDVKYIEELIGPDTFSTLPPETLDAYRDHGKPEARLERNVKQAHRVFKQLAELGIDIDSLTRQLEEEGVEKFIQPFDKLLATLTQASAQHRKTP